jgi:hypothetical protein
MPSHEITHYLYSHRENHSGTLVSGAIFRMNVIGTVNFHDRTVVEDVTGGSASGCYFEGSGLPTMVPPGENASWTVNGFSEYWPDYIAMADAYIDLVQSYILEGIAPYTGWPYTSCRAFENLQTMKMLPTGGGQAVAYASHNIWLDISLNGIMVGRASAAGPGR